MIPLKQPPGSSSMGGTGFTNAFALFNTPNVKIRDMAWLLAHEYMHNWIPRRLGSMPKQEELSYWISEGFTDYYADLVLLRSGTLSLEEYLGKYNEVMKKLYQSPMGSEPNARIAKDFWNNYDVEKLPYMRGALLASELNGKVRAASGGRLAFDDVLFGMLGGKEELNAARMEKALRAYTPEDTATLMRQRIEEGVLPVPSPTVFAKHLPIAWREFWRYDIGMDSKALIRENRIAGVVEGGAAWKAGVREGQILLRSKVTTGDPDAWIELEVKDVKETHKIRFQPRSAQSYKVPQFIIPTDLSAEARSEILAWLGVKPANVQ
jgi:predicted metalloprotease with PDZ domain